MYDPIMRVLTVLEILQARDHASGSELASRLEVNLRTVQRYIARLQDLGVPVESVRGVGGFYKLKPGFRLPPLMFTDEEAFALALGLRGLRHLGLSAFAPATEGAAAKLARSSGAAAGQHSDGRGGSCSRTRPMGGFNLG
jgi:predicted DNA-binding transcriptional regulator YafY